MRFEPVEPPFEQRVAVPVAGNPLVVLAGRVDVRTKRRPVVAGGCQQLEGDGRVGDRVEVGQHADGRALQPRPFRVARLGHPAPEVVRQHVGRDLPVDAFHHEELAAEHRRVGLDPERVRHGYVGVLRDEAHRLELSHQVVGGEHGDRGGLGCDAHHQPVHAALARVGVGVGVGVGVRVEP